MLNGTNKSITPSGFKFAAINITNFKGEKLDITDLVDEVTINESLFNISTVCDIVVIDSANFFEFHRISGNEKVQIIFTRSIPDASTGRSGSRDVQEFELEYVVASIPSYSRPKTSVQVYTLQCITEAAYLSQSIRISRAVKGTTTTILKDIINKDLGADLKKSDESAGSFNIIIPNLLASDAIKWIQKITYDEKGMGLFLYDTIIDKLQLRSQYNLIQKDNKLDGVYKHDSFFKSTTGSNDDYNQRKYRILSMSSSLGMSKIIGIKQGSFASSMTTVDMATKKFIKYKYNHEFNNTIESYPLVSDTFKLNLESVDKLYSANRTVFNNTLAISKSRLYSAGIDLQSLTKAASTHNLDTISHVLSLHGDPELRPGKIIEIKLPLSTDTTLEKLSEIADGRYDQYMSGKYLIVSSIHRFSGKGYFTEIKLKRDSSTVELI